MDPITIAAAIALAGGIFKGFTGWLGGKAQEKQGQARARQANQEAGQQAQAALAEEDEVAGEAAVRAAANGGGLDGSSADVLADIERRGQYNARSAIWAGTTKAENALYEGKTGRRQATLNGIGSVIGGASQAAGTLASASMKGG